MLINILIVDDERTVRDNLGILLSDEPKYRLYFAENGGDCLRILKKINIDIIICDINLPDMNGFDIIKEVKLNYPSITSIVITAYSSWRTARDALKLGAFDYIAKPFKSEELKLILKKALKFSLLTKENLDLKEKIKNLNFEFEDFSLIGSNQKIVEIKEMVKKIASVSSSILITGESGTGKELIARAIHENSLRSDNKLVTVNCGAIPANLLESELFGYEKGAFTGAVKEKIGYFEYADQSTLFLDEVGELPLDLQVKILRAVETKSFNRLGSTKIINSDLRIVAATNRDLTEMIQHKIFRQDLYYRLAVINIVMPPLRERKDDLPDLCNYFIKKFNKKFNKNIFGLDEEVKKIFNEYKWPGNIRELQNIIEHSVIIEDKKYLTVSSLPIILREEVKHNCYCARDYETNSYTERIDKIEADIIENELIKTALNKSKAAKNLGLSRQALQYKINRLKDNFTEIKKEI